MEYLLQVKLGCLFGLLFLPLLFRLGPSRVKCFREGLERGECRLPAVFPLLLLFLSNEIAPRFSPVAPLAVLF
ncbi:hypothetical protein XELAEV_18002891mg, partial [Xenopus laevis]